MQAVGATTVDSAVESTKKKLEEVLEEDPLTKQILAMKEEQVRLKKEKQELKRKLKNAEGRRARLKKKARQLTDEDLVHVLMWRKEAKDKKTAGEDGTQEP